MAEEIHKCHVCGEPATIFDIDPYLDEINPENRENIEEWWCDNCFREALEDI